MKILFIDIDTLRFDHLGCYGYKRNTSPNIDKIGKEGIIFNKYYCSDAPCLPSRSALSTGIFGIRNGAVGHGGTTADLRYIGEKRDFRDHTVENNLFNIFRKANMHTVSISSFAERHSSFWFNAGFNEIHNVGKGGVESGEEVLTLAENWLDNNKNKDDWFMHFHIWDPHTPYRTPENFKNKFENTEFNSWIDNNVLEKSLQHIGPHSANEINMYDDKVSPEFPRQIGKIKNLDDVKKLIDEYDCSINYADFLVGKVFHKLKELSIYDDVQIIISSDHGENMGELGIFAEHATADEHTCHIPMIIKWNGCSTGIVDNQLHYSLDLVPTIADLLKVPHCDNWDGESFFDGMYSKNYEGRKSLVISQMAHVCQRSARFDNWLYVRTYHDGFHLFDKEMLFNIENDFYEQNDVKDEFPEICAIGAKIILDWQDEMMAKSTSQIDPLWTVLKEGGPHHTRGHLQGYIKRLKETNRELGADKLIKKHLKKI